jgi:diguanylate cyclase (GGDEF)-like protein
MPLIAAMAWRDIWIWLLRLAALLALAVPVAMAPAHAHISSPSGEHPSGIALNPCFKRVAATDRADDLLRNPAGFDCATKQTAHGSGSFWAHVQVPDGVSRELHHLRWASVWQDDVQLFVHYADGTSQQIDLPAAESGHFVHVGGYYTVGLPSVAAPKSILFRIEGSGNMRGILLGPELLSTNGVTRIDVQRSTFYGVFLGFCLALLAYNLMMWRVMRQPYIIAYCAMLVAAICYAFASSATISQIFPFIEENDRLRLNHLTVAAIALTAMWFARRFFDDMAFSKNFNRLIYGCMASIALATMAFVVLAPWRVALLDQLYILSFVGMFVVGAGILVRGWRLGGPAERLFVISWSLPFVLNSLRLLHGFDLLPQSFWLDNATLVAMGAEALLSSMIIAHRIRFIRADRDAARAEEAEARHLADTDELTGLGNRRALMRAACPPQGAAGHYRLILIDVDHFKTINDSVGHSAGDAVLQKIADVIRAALRPDVVAARIGGEEFALLFPTGNVDRRYYGALLSRIRALPPVAGQRITISMGAANGWLGGTEGEWLALYRAADAALYQAKESGRNRLIVAPRYRDVPAAA